ncbi:6360_t:CDS:2 [Paraglomus brasilianum]|uniref:6360_t:CDS:1 n=1 Tax=Paraglomus brasilianum TaxID=144538 RepID=A0A9N9BQQ2_9GLOM|nr:6360_t:CDS:2 [Paraglomus brasilianum]
MADGFPTPNPQLVSLLQGKLGSLVGKPSGYIETLPEEVKRRINGLKFIQTQHAKLEARFQEEILALEKKYLEQYKPLYDKRSKMVQGELEPSEEEVEAGKKIDGLEQPAIDDVKISEVVDGPVKGIPEFWLTALKNLYTISETITDRDEACLKHLIDIRMAYLEKPGFRLDFEFEENPFFTNRILTKTYYYQDEPGYGGDFVYDHAEGTSINWKEGKALNLVTETKKQKHKETKETRIVKTTVPAETFFQFFSPPIVPDTDDAAEEDEDLDERLEADYQMGEDIKEKLIPRAIDWYTGKALQYEETSKQNGKGGTNPPECKQQ